MKENTKKYVLWGRKDGDRDWEETILVSSGTKEQIEKVKILAKKDGWTHFRETEENWEEPDFKGTIKERKMGSRISRLLETKISESNESEILAWFDKAKKEIEDKSKKDNPNGYPYLNNTLTYTKGPKYYKVFISGPEGVRRAAYMFIDMEGNIFKPASFNAPASGIRGTVAKTDPTVVDLYGDWLYRR